MRATLVITMTALLSLLLPVGAFAAGPLTATAAPTVVGAATYAETLTAVPGTWEPAPTAFAYQWLRDGVPIAAANAATYAVGLDDLDHSLAVQVTASGADGGAGTAVSAPTSVVTRAALAVTREPKVTGVLRYGRTVRATSAGFAVDPTRVRVAWLRDGVEIDGASASTYTLQPADVGARLQVAYTASAPGRTDAVAVSSDRPRRATVLHRRDLRRTVTYRVETRGRITTSVKEFAALAQQTYADARGWRGAGIGFRRVARGGSFTLVLAAAGEVPRFSGACSAQYSCRVGRFVVINQDRWLDATPPWNAAGGSLRDYRHLVVDHETGHWLGLGHAACSRPGALAPVMMQQSKGLGGCRFNPFPTLGELASRAGR